MKKYRFFGGCMQMQADWLNRMAAQGWQLVRTGKLAYEFEPCEPGAVQYCVEYVADQSRAETENYKAFLEGLGYRVFDKNINLQWSAMKVRVNPWAKSGARIVTNATTLDRELLIVEKKNDGRPFELYTSLEDRVAYCKRLRFPWLVVMLCFAVCAVAQRSWEWGIFALVSLAMALRFSIEIWKNKKRGILEESGEPPAKGRRSLRPWLLPAILAVVAALCMFRGPSYSSGFKIGWIENSWGDRWTASYASFTGTYSRRLSTKDGDTVHVEIETKSGTLDLEMVDSDGTAVYTGTDLQTCALDIPVNGRVTVKLTAKGHQGKFALDWKDG